MNKVSVYMSKYAFVLMGFVCLMALSNGSGAAVLVDMRGKTPEEAAVTVNANKPSGALKAVLTLTTLDADFPNEGELLINGNTPIAIFGGAGVKANDNKIADVTITTPASYWLNGPNTLQFNHTNTAGFVVNNAEVSFVTDTSGTASAPGASFPVDMQGITPEETSIVLNVSKPADAVKGVITLTTYDADFPTEGELVINGNTPLALFGTEGVKANDQNTADIAFSTQASYWKNGNNTLIFRHKNSAGFVIDNATVSFVSGSSGGSDTPGASFPIDLQGEVPEQTSIVVSISKPAAASNGVVTLTTYDADFPTEGELVINGKTPIALFGADGVKANDQNSADITINTPASYWNDGNNSLVFRHLKTAGYIIDDVKVSFDSSASDVSSGTSTNLTPSGPIVISGQRNVVISGLHITNPNGRCIQVREGSYNVVIENSEIGPCGESAVYVHSSEKVTVRNNYIHDADDGVMSVQSKGINVTGNTIEYVSSGVSTWIVEQINVSNNSFKNMQGSYPKGSFVSFARVSGNGNRINNNVGINEYGVSHAEDALNVYESSGNPSDYIQVNNNIIIGGGPSKSGGGIILGDSGGSYQKAENNILVNPGSYGVTISAGHHIMLSKNKVFNDGTQTMANNGLNVGWEANVKGIECRDLEISNNEITFWRGEDQFRGETETWLSPYYKWSGCDVNNWGTNKFDTPKSQPANLDASILPASLRQYVQ